MAVAVPYIMTGLAVKGAVDANAAAKDQRKAAKEQAAAQAFQAKKAQRIADIRAQRERMAIVAASRRAAGEVQNRASASGTSTSTASGALGSISSQTSSSIHAGDQISSLAEEASIFNQQSSARAQEFLDSAGRHQRSSDIFSAAGTVTSIWKKT